VSDRLWARVLGACVVAGCLLGSPPARAQDDPTTTAAARERFKEGVAHFDKKEYEKARAAFLQAYALKKHPAVLLNLAQSEVRSGHERDAAKHFTQYLREASDASAGEREAAQQGLAAARAAVVELQVSVDDSGAEIFVDGNLEGISPLADPVFVDPGSHSIEAKKGDRIATQSVAGKGGEKKEARLALASPAPVASAPAATNTADGEPTEDAGVEAEVSTGSREPFFRWVLTRPAGFIPAGATVLLGLGAGGFAIGSTVRYSDADHAADEINTAAAKDNISTQGVCVDPFAKFNPPDDARAREYEVACSKHQNYVDQGDTFKTVAIGLGVGAGVAAVATVVLYFTTAPKTGASAKGSESTSEVAATPWVTPSGDGGVTVFGRF
jgi:hypothetical protein